MVVACPRTADLRAEIDAQRSAFNCFAVMRSSSKEGSYLRLVDFCITQL